ncbi:phycobilisome linker polypeptide [Oscillatoria acuminata]|uniref:Phycobilisome Linker polypeptide/CpcD/allophycocyanin linker domain protein n=1 Tax=Oscillatoria acuminata PCC 6304 TaxID=56110 RepID=K9TDK6_9CYAN|nr:phycobilisome linker polypeptide [Oscillatoria acuminata]AFY80952.1 Phycobilisome Linker polypeptide/CpcD/allophycocyanin linker domain protein [Oscillatoria acuminata PCC 6304]
MAITTAASRLGTMPYGDTGRVELRQNSSEEDIEAVIRSVYRQVLGNDYVMKSERLNSAESLLKNGKMTVRDFVRAVAKSELYKEKFLYPNFQTRVIELNYKHLLGRAPYDEAEVIYHLDLYETEGFDAEIDSYIDSPEYESSFGDNIVPYYRGFDTQNGQKTVGFNRMFRLYRGYANSDRAQLEGSKSRLIRELSKNQTNTIVAPSGGSDGWSYRPSLDSAPATCLGGAFVGFGKDGGVYRIEVTGLRQTGVRRSCQTFIVPFESLSTKIQQIVKQGGKIASITTA